MRAGRLGDAHRLGHGRLEDLDAVAVADLLDDLVGEVGATVEHGGDGAPHPQVLVGVGADVLDGVEQLADAAMAERLALHRDEHLVGGGEAADGEDARATAGSR